MLHGENMTRLSSSGPATPESRRVGWRNGSAVVLTAAVVAALFIPWKCSPDPLPPPAPVPCVAIPNAATKTVDRRAISTEQVPADAECIECAPPLPPLVKGDAKCELDRGEGDFKSVDYDPASCGRCGDSIKHPLEVQDVAVSIDVAQAIALSGITFTGTPVPVGCLADTYSCGPGGLQGSVRTGIIKEIKTSEGSVYTHEALVVGCPVDKAVPVARRMTPVCADDVIARAHGLFVDALHASARAIRVELGAAATGVTVTVHVDVDGRGRIAPSGGAVACTGGCAKPGEKDVLAQISASLARNKVAGGACTLGDLSARLPVEREGK